MIRAMQGFIQGAPEDAEPNPVGPPNTNNQGQESTVYMDEDSGMGSKIRLTRDLGKLAKELEENLARNAKNSVSGEDLNRELFNTGSKFANATREGEYAALAEIHKKSTQLVQENADRVALQLQATIKDLNSELSYLRRGFQKELGSQQAIGWLERRLDEANVQLQVHEKQRDEFIQTRAKLIFAEKRLAEVERDNAANNINVSVLNELRKQNATLQAHITRLQGTIEKKNALEQTILDRERELGDTKNELGAANSRIEALREQVNELTSKLAQAPMPPADLAPEAPSGSPFDDSTNKQLAVENGVLRNTVERMRTELAAAKKLELEYSKLRGELGKYHVRENGEANIESITEQLHSLSVSNGGLHMELNVLREQRDERNANAQRALTDLAERLELMNGLSRAQEELENMERVSSLREGFARDKLEAAQQLQARNIELQAECSRLQRLSIAEKVEWGERVAALSMEIDTLSKWRTIAARITKALLAHNERLAKFVQEAMLSVEKRLTENMRAALMTTTTKTIELARQAHRDMLKDAHLRATIAAIRAPKDENGQTNLLTNDWNRHGYGSVSLPAQFKPVINAILNGTHPHGEDVLFIECDHEKSEQVLKESITKALKAKNIICLHLCPLHDNIYENITTKYEIANFQFRGDPRGYSCLVSNDK